MSERELELTELVKRLLNYVTFHKVRNVNRIGFHLVENTNGFDVCHYVSNDLAAILNKLAELTE